MAYDKVNRSTLMRDCRKLLDDNTRKMIAASLKPLKVTGKQDVMDTKAELRLGLLKGAQISPILFLLYINYLPDFSPR